MCLLLFFFFLSIRRTPRPTRTDTPFPDTTLFLSDIRFAVETGRRLQHPVAETLLPGRDRRVAGFILERNGEQTDEPMMHGKTELRWRRSGEHTSELQSLMRISYAVFCLTQKKLTKKHYDNASSRNSTHK